jgi:Flp pilus assembly protein TadG
MRTDASRPEQRRVTGDRGLSSIEVVFLAPLIILFVLVLVGLGQLVSGRGAVDGAARDAARAGSLERDQASARASAERVALSQLDDICVSGSVRTTPESRVFAPGGLYVVTVTCRVRGLDTLGLNLSSTLTGRSSSPIDTYRRAG